MAESNATSDGALATVYDALYEDDVRVCTDIPDELCSAVPQNFFLQAGAHALTQLGDALTNSRTTLPWLLAALGAPGWIAALLVPLRESGSMLPQLAIAAAIRRLPRRQGIYTLGAVLQGAAISGIGISALQLNGRAAGFAILALVVVFSLARGLCSVASKDVLGKTVPKKRRGRVSGLASSVAGIGTLAFAGAVAFGLEGLGVYSWLFVGAGALYGAAALLYGRIKEAPGATDGGKNGFTAALGRLRLLLDDPVFGRFVLARSLLTGTSLLTPFIVLLARERADATLAFFLLAQGAAALLGGNFWGAMADRSSRRLMIVTAVAAGIIGTGVVLAEHFAPALTATVWFLPLTFFLFAALHDGTRLGRKTYVVDLAGADKRADYVAVSNTVLGLVLLLAGMAGALVQLLGNTAAILFFSGCALTAVLLLLSLPEVQES